MLPLKEEAWRVGARRATTKANTLGTIFLWLGNFVWCAKAATEESSWEEGGVGGLEAKHHSTTETN